MEMKILSKDISEKDIDKTVTLSGWVNKRRDHGGIIFVDLRDHTGIVQIVFNPDNKDIFKEAEILRSEFVISVTGKITARSEDTINEDISSGKIEVVADHLAILNNSETPPFMINDHNVSEDLIPVIALLQALGVVVYVITLTILGFPEFDKIRKRITAWTFKKK